MKLLRSSSRGRSPAACAARAPVPRAPPPPRERAASAAPPETFGRPLVDEDRLARRSRGDESRSLLGGPGRAVATEVAGERLLAPRNCIGAAIGANADTDWYRPGFLSATTSAPWPPIECPKIPCRSRPTGNWPTTPRNSRVDVAVHPVMPATRAPRSRRHRTRRRRRNPRSSSSPGTPRARAGWCRRRPAAGQAPPQGAGRPP